MKNLSLKSLILSFSFKVQGPKITYRNLAYLATVLTGFASLCAQVVWQKYLTILVGSETRSISLVVAIFLLGLALGYYFFGKLTERKWTRWRLLKIYGYVELATALYIAVFYIYFSFLKHLSFNSPAYLLIDIAISFLALFLPTFLMGASIPALTSTLPENSKEIHATHAKVYGWNAFGAFLGVLFSGFYLLQAFGLEFTLVIAGVINFIAGMIFMGNPLEGDVHRQTEFPSFPSRPPNSFYMLFTFLTGAIVISFEVLFIRLLNLTLGAGVYNFPIVLSLFVGGLAIGSLSIKSHKISVSFFIRQILITSVLLGILFMLSPYWSIWINHIRVSLLSIPSNYWAFKWLIYLFVALFLFPAVFFMGRLLPLTYALLKKNEKNYGAICGYLYFFNTLGTVCGTLIIGYLAFYIFNLDDLFKINLMILLGLGLVVTFYERKAWSLILSFFLFLSVIFLPDWDRTGHYLGYFRVRSPNKLHHFKKLFYLPKHYGEGEKLYFNDGPDVSVSLIGYKNREISPELKKLLPSKKSYYDVSFIVNGKAIGSSLGDFSTMFLLSSLAYLYAPERAEGLSSAVIGLGTGISAGVLGKIEKSSDVTVLEIAPEVIDNVKRAPSFNFEVISNPKIKILAQDGFKYFTKTKKKFDMIVSEPSNPWIVGVENVFSREFYEMAKSSLAQDGILVQWVQLYSIDDKTLKIMFHTLKQVFPYAKLYRIGSGDMAIMASPKPLRKSFLKERFFDPLLLPYHKALGFHEPEDLYLAQIFSEDLFEQIAKSNVFGLHTLVTPKLAYRGDKTFFVSNSLVPEDMAPQQLFNSLELENKKIQAFKKYSSFSPQQINEKCLQRIAFLCSLLSKALFNKQNFEDEDKKPSLRWQNYLFLRKRSLIAHNEGFLEKLKAEILKNQIKNGQLIFSYLNQLLSQKQSDKAQQDLDLFYEKKLLPEKAVQSFKEHIKRLKESPNSTGF